MVRIHQQFLGSLSFSPKLCKFDSKTTDWLKLIESEVVSLSAYIKLKNNNKNNSNNNCNNTINNE